MENKKRNQLARNGQGNTDYKTKNQGKILQQQKSAGMTSIFF